MGMRLDLGSNRLYGGLLVEAKLFVRERQRSTFSLRSMDPCKQTNTLSSTSRRQENIRQYLVPIPLG